MSVADPPLVKKLDWDSGYFGFNVAFVQKSMLTPAEQERVEAFVRAEKIVLLQYLCNCHDRQAVLTAEASGYSFVDIRFTLRRTADAPYPNVDLGPYRLARATVADIPALQQIASDAYRDSRYSFDGKFERRKTVEFYQLWVEKGVRGTLEDYVYALYDGAEPVAFCTIKELPGKQAKIGLVGVTDTRRGAGLGTMMLSNTLGKVHGDGVQSVVVVTQGRNYPAQRLYQKSGFVTEKLELWYHKWYAG